MRRFSKRTRASGRGIDEIRLREVGDLSPRKFSHLFAASENLVLRLGIHQKLEKHRGCVNTLSFNADGDIILTGSDDRMVVLWNWDAGLIKLEFQSGHSRNVLQARMMPYTDDRTIVTCGADGEVRYAQILEGGQVATTLLGQHDGRAHKIAVEPGSPHIFYSCGEDGLLQRFDLRTKSATELFVCNSLEDKSDSMPIINLYATAIDPRNPNIFAVAGSDEYARIYDMRRYRRDGSSLSSHPTDCLCPAHLMGDRQVGITGLAFSEQSELLASYNDEFIYLFSNDHRLGPNPAGRHLRGHLPSIPENSNTRTEPRVYRGHRNCDTLKGVSFFGPNCEYVASGSDCGRIFIWRKRDGELLQVLTGDKCVVNCVEPHPYANVIASSGIDNDIKIWTPNSVEPASPVYLNKTLDFSTLPCAQQSLTLRPAQLDYCIISSYKGEEDNGCDIDYNDEDDNPDDAENMPMCCVNT